MEMFRLYYNNLGVSYGLGEGVERDDQKAVEFFNKAIEIGHKEAQENLDSMNS